MWEKTIGVEFSQGNNAAVEAAIYAPKQGTGGGIAGRRERAQELINATGVEQSVTTYKDLVSLARQQSVIGGATRGACKICGGLGHLTKQCRNHLSSNPNAAAGAAGPSSGLAVGAASVAALPSARGLIEDSEDSLSLSSSSSDSDSSSDSGDRSRKRKREKKHKRDKSKHKHKHSKSKKKHKHKSKDKDRHKKRSRKSPRASEAS